MKIIYARLCAVFIAITFLNYNSFAQEIEISGRVTDGKDGSGLPGVGVVNITSKTGASTDINGSFKVKATVGNILEFRFLGYKTETRTVAAGVTTIGVVMNEETKTLSEAVVIGYGTMSKKDLSGSITSISSKDFQKGIITTPEQLIAGKAPGVQITSNGGSPGGGSTIRIRGGASLSASNDPLLVIDGIPVDNGGIAGSPNPLSLINPNDIETFTVLKDAAATAIYGSRASNGVIIITTKKGIKGAKPEFTISSQNSISTIVKKVDVLSADDFRALVNEQGSEDQKKLLGKYSTDWQKVIFQQALTSDNNISYGGSIGKLPFRISTGFLNQQGILRTDKMDRQSVGINLNPSLLDGSLKINLNLKGSRASNQFANGGAIGAAIGYDPTQPIFQTTDDGRRISPRFGGYREWLNGDGRPNSQASNNPLGLLSNRSNVSEVYRTLSNLTLDYAMPFLPELRANLNVGVDLAEGKGKTFVTDSAASNYLNKGSRTEYKQQKRAETIEFYLNYGKDLPSISSRIDFLAGTAYQNFWTKNYNYRPLNYKGDTLDKNVPNSARPKFPFDIPQNRLMSFYGRVNYIFKGKWNAYATIRQDGSSRFAPNNRWGFFPSAALSYRISDEAFLKNSKVLSNLKIRASWGITGQQDIGDNYSYQSYFNIGNNNALYPFGDIYYNMARPGAYDPTRKWEQTATYNIALDYGFFKDRITGSIDVYMKKTSDLLNNVPTAAGSNFGDNITTNVGTLENKGIEFAINTIPIQTKDINWDLGFNATYNENKITKLNTSEDPNYPGAPTGGISGGIGNNAQINSVGFPANSFFVYKQVYENGKPVEGVFQDLNGDGKLTELDKYRFRQPAPRMFFGLSSNVTAYGFFLGFVIRANQGNYVYNNVQSNNGSLNSVLAQQSALSNVSVNYLESRFTGNSLYGNDDKRLLSDYYVKDASFIRMDNLNFGYNFGKVFNEKVNVAINGTIQNVFVITKYKGIDPEIGGGIDNNFYPRPRTYTLGLQLSF